MIGLDKNGQRQLFISKIYDLIFRILGFLFLLFSFAVLFVLVGNLVSTGLSRVSIQFLTSFPSRIAANAGILSAWVGSLAIMLMTALCAIPLGVASGVYLEEYAPKNKFTTFLELNITNLAGVPSIIFGLMALGLFVYKLSLGQSIITAGMTLGLLILPVIIVTTREAIRTIPVHIREASYAVGATKLQTIIHHIIPYSAGGIITGIIIALSRAIGETAPLITIGALTFIAFLPTSPFSSSAPYVSAQWMLDPFTALPIQMFNWLSRPQEEFHVNAAATGLVLIVLTLSLSMVAIVMRNYFRKRIKW
jgi:phosphate transport system permease protein